MTSDHLTDEQIDDYLLGDLDPAALAHLDACDPCMARVAELAQPIADFSAATLAWGERRSATLPLRPVGAGTRTQWLRRFTWAPLGGAIAAAAVAFAVALPMLHHHDASIAATHPAVTAPAHTTAEDEVARDNQLLQQVDQALDATVSGADFGLQPTGAAHGTHTLQN